MKLIARSSMLAAALVGMLAGSARAEGIVEVKVPFPFDINGKQFAAGSYEIRTDAQGVALIRGVDNKSACFVFTMRAAGVDPVGNQAALVFTPHEKEYRLTAVWDSGFEGYDIKNPSSRPAVGRVRRLWSPCVRSGGEAGVMHVVPLSRL